MTLSTLVDLVKVYTPTSGQGALTLGAAVPGFLTPSTVIPAMTSGSVVSYGIADPSGNEVGQGILTLTGSVWTLTRGVTQSSNGGAPILCTGQATVALTLRAEDVFQGATNLASGLITAPVAFIDLALPAGYSSFSISLTGLEISVETDVYFGVSTNAGKTFFNDTTHFDTYGTIINSWSVSGAGAVAEFNIAANAWDALAPLQNSDVLPGTVDIDLSFCPGDNANSFRALAHCLVHGIRSAAFFSEETQVMTWLNPSATVPPVYGRVNLIRVQPYGNGDVNPPTSGQTINAGSYTLWGLNA